MAMVVLVHGTTAGGWVWKKIAPQLRAAGHQVYTPTLTGLGERQHLLTRETDLNTHIMDVVNTLEFEELEQVVLVGHSYGGAVIEGVADRVPARIARLVYLDTLIVRNGESCFDLMGSQMQQHYKRLVERDGEGWLVPVLIGGNDGPTLNRPHPFKSWTQPISLSNRAAAALPRVYVRFSADKGEGQPFALSMAESWQRVRASGWPYREVDTIHQITPDPQPKADILLELLAED